MLKSIKIIVLAALAGVFFSACAEEKDETNASIQKRILDAYLEINYPNRDYTVTKSGLVILNHEEGEGIYPKKYTSAYINYSIKGLDGNYQTTNIEEVARQLGTYSAGSYFGPEITEIGYGKTMEGLSEALCLMNRGARMTVIIPPHLSAMDYPDGYNEAGYTNVKTETSDVNIIYDIKMGHVVSNLEKFQTDSLESFKKLHYPGLDSLANGYYFKKLSGTSKDTIESGTTADVWYVGRLLDGYVFDTNIKDTAKKYGLYNPENEYAPLEVKYKEKYEDMSGSSDEAEEEGGYVAGFAKALKSMTFGDRAITFFSSTWGYGSTATGSIPAYSMLHFEIYVEKESD